MKLATIFFNEKENYCIVVLSKEACRLDGTTEETIQKMIDGFTNRQYDVQLFRVSDPEFFGQDILAIN